MASLPTAAVHHWFIAGSVPFMLAGAIHVAAALRDVVQPTFFAPVQRSVGHAMKGTGVRFRELFPGGSGLSPSIWRAWLGFNLSHGLGTFTFGLLCLIVALHDAELVVRIDALRLLAMLVAAAYVALSLRYWFYAPTIMFGIGAACFAVAEVNAQ